MIFIKKVAVYHATNASESKAYVYERTMQKLREYASKFGSIEKEYLDKSLLLSQQPEKEKLFHELKNYDVLVVKSFRFLSQNIGVVITELYDMFKGMEVYSTDDGCLYMKEPPYEKHLKTAVYHSTSVVSGNRKVEDPVCKETQIEIIKHFIKNKTCWELEDVYCDDIEYQSEKTQTGLLKLIENSSKYDLVICRHFNLVNKRSAKFFSYRNRMKLDMYSMREGCLAWERGNEK